jgi:leucyl-tRNA synthetase
MAKYDHTQIEAKWQQKWKENNLYTTPDAVSGKTNYYSLIEFPYPSGNLHVGHWYAFTVPDMFARFKRMGGDNVLFPIGFDAFGLPAENAAIKNNLDPKAWTEKNIEHMTTQLESMGASFDWSRKVVTCEPEYYRWTQWLFIQLYNNKLAYKKKAIVNWDPVDKTVLANEQVLPNGTAERSGAVVEKKELEQWFLNITKYADRLIDDLESLNWPEEIKQSQRSWIGRSEGAEIDFKIDGKEQKITVFTTRPDTLFGVTYMVLAPEHPLVEELKDSITNYDDVSSYARASQRKSDIDREKEKTGVELKGITAINPATEEVVPIFIADYVLMGYGTGAIMAVPAHDERDRAFAEKFNLPIKPVILSTIYHSQADDPFLREENILEMIQKNGAYANPGRLINSKSFTGLTSEEAKEKITEQFGEKKTTYKLRDWLISRQRYWGCPIPIVYDPEGKAHPIPDEHLPWLLPTDVDFAPTGVPPLGTSKELKERTEKIFGKGWTPEYDTMDTFIDSSWYFLRYIDPHNTDTFASKEKLKEWMPIKRYSGGAEHTTMHVLYSRFFHKALNDLGLVNESEPFVERYNRGLILGTDGQKMSKRWGNVIDPDEQVRNVGADSVRMYLGFIGPYNVPGNYPWDMGGLVGVRRFLERVWDLSEKLSNTTTSEVLQELHKTIKKVNDDIPAFKMNTAISQMMIFVNAVDKGTLASSDFEIFLKVLAPFAPHMAEELWSRLGHTTSIHLEKWPEYDASKLVSDSVTIAIQINGKTRGTVSAPTGSSEEEVLAQARQDNRVSSWIEKGKIKKVIYVQDRLLSVVTVGLDEGLDK